MHTAQIQRAISLSRSYNFQSDGLCVLHGLAPALCASVVGSAAGQALKETLDDVRKRRLTYDNARGTTASPSREVCAVKEVRCGRSTRTALLHGCCPQASQDPDPQPLISSRQCTTDWMTHYHRHAQLEWEVCAIYRLGCVSVNVMLGTLMRMLYLSCLGSNIKAFLQVVGALMHEIECILHEYLSFNWDRVEDIYDANSVYLSEDGLRCLWRSNHHLSVGASLFLCNVKGPLHGYSRVQSLLE